MKEQGRVAQALVSEAVYAHENIYIDVRKVYSLSSLSLFTSCSLLYFPIHLVASSPSLPLSLLTSFTLPASLPPRLSPLVPCSSPLFSVSTNDGNHLQTHQLTLFQSYGAERRPFLVLSSLLLPAALRTARGIVERRRISRS